MMKAPLGTLKTRLTRLVSVVFALICAGLTLLLAMGPLGGTLFASNAQAQAAEATPKAQAEAEAEAEAPAEPEPVHGEPSALGSVFDADPLQSLADSLRRKEEDLAAREARLAEREKAIETLRLEAQQTLQRIEQVHKEMQAIATQADAQRQKQLKKWIDIYQKMDPAKVATLMLELQPDFQLELLSQMDTNRAAKILNAFPPEKAAELGQKLNR